MNAGVPHLCMAVSLFWLRAGAAVSAGRRDRAGPRRQHKHRLHAAPVRAQGDMCDRHDERRVFVIASSSK